MNWRLNISDLGTMFYPGGVIHAADFCPLPEKSPSPQYLVMAPQNDPDDKYSIASNCDGFGCVQFWNCGVINSSRKHKVCPKLELILAHHYGIIWSVKWCPTGCFNIQVIDGIMHIWLIFSFLCSKYETKNVYFDNLNFRVKKLNGSEF